MTAEPDMSEDQAEVVMGALAMPGDRAGAEAVRYDSGNNPDPGEASMTAGDEGDSQHALPSDSSLALLQRAKAGDEAALNCLLERYRPALRRWASGRIPHHGDDALDTEDLVQDTLLAAVDHLATFEPRREGALRAYLRQSLLNRIRDTARRAKRHPAAAPLDGSYPDAGASPLDQAIGRDMVEDYETALARLRDEDREAIVARIEMGCTYGELAEALGKPTPDAARMAVARALVRLAKEIRHAS